MKIYTSYYYQIRNFPPNLVGLSTAIWPPKYINLGEKDKRGVLVVDCPPLKPGAECEGLCAGKCNPKHPQDCSFLQVYYQQLCKLDFNDFINHLKKLKFEFCKNELLDDVDFALIVFETPTNPCSERFPLQNWMRKNGIEIEEWHKDET